MDGKERSMKVLEAHHTLRRAGYDKNNEDHQFEGSLMHTIICDEQDTPESLQRCIDTMKTMQKPVEDLGAARHPTSQMSYRTAMVVERKLEVLSTILAQTDEFEAACATKMEMFDRLLDGASVSDVAGAAIGFKKRIKKCVHQPDGKPENADRGSFNLFCTSFGLPGEHQAVLRAQELLSTEVELWAQAILDRAREEIQWERDLADECGRSSAGIAVMKIIEIAIGVGVPEEHKCLDEAERIGIAAYGSAVLRNAQSEQAKDEAKAQCHEAGDAAKEAAVRVEAVIKAANAFGVERGHPDLTKASIIARDLRAESVRRLAVHLLKGKQKLPGENEKAANTIEQAVRMALQAGVSVEHPKIHAVRNMAQQAREEEALLKRLHAAQLRKEAKARADQAAREAKVAKAMLQI